MHVALFIAGVAAGLAIYQGILALIFGDTHYTMCDICRYKQKKAAERRRRK